MSIEKNEEMYVRRSFKLDPKKPLGEGEKNLAELNATEMELYAGPVHTSRRGKSHCVASTRPRKVT